MSDEGFFREVNEELRKDQARAIWDRFGPIALAAALLVVIGTAAWVGYDRWTTSRANQSGDAFSQALRLANEGRSDEALGALQALQTDGYGSYPMLARMRAATVMADKGDFPGAVAGFDAVGADGSVPQVIRDMAKLRAALILVDSGSYADVSQRVEALTSDTNPLRHTAREALGLSAWKEGRAADALRLFEQISADQASPRNIRERAAVMLELVRSSGTAS